MPKLRDLQIELNEFLPQRLANTSYLSRSRSRPSCRARPTAKSLRVSCANG